MCVHVTLRPVNPADVFTLQGIYPGCASPCPKVPGLEGVGKVVKLGPGTGSKVKVGDRVVVWGTAGAGEGTWAEHMVIPESMAIPVPDARISDEAAAGKRGVIVADDLASPNTHAYFHHLHTFNRQNSLLCQPRYRCVHD